MKNIRTFSNHPTGKFEKVLTFSCPATPSRLKTGEEEERDTRNLEKFQLPYLSYDLKRHSLLDNTLNAKVEWRIKFSPKAGGSAQESETVLDVTFKKEYDGWKIKEVKTLN
jgi:hypothetical protein